MFLSAYSSRNHMYLPCRRLLLPLLAFAIQPRAFCRWLRKPPINSAKEMLFGDGVVFGFGHQKGADETYDGTGEEEEINRVVGLQGEGEGSGGNWIRF